MSLSSSLSNGAIIYALNGAECPLPPPTAPSDMASSAGASKTAEPPKRRPRVPVSCAECRRLKIRCDRQAPCETCTKKGCAAICSNDCE
ncbi:hypothetical protein FA95DRAFT_1567539 [Auriscalpium vulgare]|uniref:Uncharacterized protein n=1 Tax=Auriscalpium vulgare TaxID=40419 RepID=A0ACB8R500_9AGAM|nr:hypothetical protein FA95DRAFT_1567539 [Auriscalpium vulgare]